MEPVAELFNRMDEWRTFPSYQLERRADILFPLYLAEVLEVHLEQMGLLQMPPALPVIMAGKSRRGAPAASKGVVVTAPSSTPRIVYVQPNGDGPDVVSFEEFADVVARNPDTVSQRFAALCTSGLGSKWEARIAQVRQPGAPRKATALGSRCAASAHDGSRSTGRRAGWGE